MAGVAAKQRTIRGVLPRRYFHLRCCRRRRQRSGPREPALIRSPLNAGPGIVFQANRILDEFDSVADVQNSPIRAEGNVKTLGYQTALTDLTGDRCIVIAGGVGGVAQAGRLG